MLPKGARNNDLSKTLSKKDWDKLRNFTLKKANGQCEILGGETISKNFEILPQEVL